MLPPCDSKAYVVQSVRFWDGDDEERLRCLSEPLSSDGAGCEARQQRF